MTPSESLTILHCTRIPQNMIICQISFIYFFYENYNSVLFLMKKKRLSTLLEPEALNFFCGCSWFPQSQPGLVFVLEKKRQNLIIIVTYLIQFTVGISVFSASASR